MLLSVPDKGVDATVVMGVNEGTYDPERDHVVSNASCTMNCVAPMVKVLDEAFGIDKGLMTTIHGYTNDQVVLGGIAVRVPVEDGSLTDLSVVLGRAVTAEEVNAVFREAADGPLKGVLWVYRRPDRPPRRRGRPRLLDLTEYVAARLPLG